jgi:hypothetical protein
MKPIIALAFFWSSISFRAIGKSHSQQSDFNQDKSYQETFSDADGLVMFNHNTDEPCLMLDKLGAKDTSLPTCSVEQRQLAPTYLKDKNLPKTQVATFGVVLGWTAAMYGLCSLANLASSRPGIETGTTRGMSDDNWHRVRLHLLRVAAKRKLCAYGICFESREI